MIDYTFDESTLTLHLCPTGPLREEDFDLLSAEVDPIIEKHGRLNGLLIETKDFPGWEDLGSAVSHFRFVRNHHKTINRVAVVTDSIFGDAAEHIASHFVSAEIRHFPSGETKEAKEWIVSED